MTGADVIDKILDYTKLNPKSFSERIGLDRPQAIYDIQSGKTKTISPRMADKIISVFPEIDRVWLLTGEGEILKTAETAPAPTGVGERVKNLLGFKGVTPYVVSMQTGISQATMSRIINNSTAKPSSGTIEVLAKYFGTTPDWILTGRGEMIKDTQETPSNSHRIRYWVDVDATAGGVTLFDDMVSSQYIDLAIPEFRDCTDAVNLYGDSMLPLYKSGQIIILKEWKESFIDYGNVYLVVTKKGNRMVKYLRKGSDAEHVLCVSENKEFDSFEILMDDILCLYLVKGSIAKNTL